MRYEGMVYRPPSEAYSLIVQITIGCAHNKCTFCSMYKEKKFRIRPVSEVLEDLEMARRRYSHVEKVFLADGDALVLKTEHLVTILDRIRELFPECKRVGIYGRHGDIARKTPEELMLLRDKGLGIVYLGAESGSAKVLEDICKNATPEELISAVRKVEDCGIKASVTFISGIAGKDNWQEHAIETGKMITAMNASYVSLLTLMVEPGTPLYKDIKEKRFQLLSPAEILLETELLLENANPEKPCVFRSNHASNYLSLKGDLPQDKAQLLAQVRYAKSNMGLLKDERFRAL